MHVSVNWRAKGESQHIKDFTGDSLLTQITSSVTVSKYHQVTWADAESSSVVDMSAGMQWPRNAGGVPHRM